MIFYIYLVPGFEVCLNGKVVHISTFLKVVHISTLFLYIFVSVETLFIFCMNPIDCLHKYFNVCRK